MLHSIIYKVLRAVHPYDREEQLSPDRIHVIIIIFIVSSQTTALGCRSRRHLGGGLWVASLKSFSSTCPRMMGLTVFNDKGSPDAETIFFSLFSIEHRAKSEGKTSQQSMSLVVSGGCKAHEGAPQCQFVGKINIYSRSLS